MYPSGGSRLSLDYWEMQLLSQICGRCCVSKIHSYNNSERGTNDSYLTLKVAYPDGSGGVKAETSVLGVLQLKDGIEVQIDVRCGGRGVHGMITPDFVVLPHHHPQLT